MKKLTDLTLEELWQLFSIFLTEHRAEWKDWFLEEKKNLENLFKKYDVKRISHIGSTAIKNIWAKPIVDILVEIDQSENMQSVSDILESNGYICMKIESADRRSFNKGYTSDGFAEKVFHLHLRREGDNDEIYFCDYLNAHPEIAREYEGLKLKLWKEYERDRDAYTNAKSEFVKKYTEIAKKHLS